MCIQYIYWEKAQMLKKFLSYNINDHHSFTFSLWFLNGLKHKVCLSKTVCGVFNIWFRFVFIKVYIFFKNNRKTTYCFALRPLIFKLQQEVLKFNNLCVSWSSPKTDLEANFLSPEIEVLKTLVFLNSNF